MKLYLVRHGESVGNVDRNVHRTTADHAIELSQLGFVEADEAGRRLSRIVVDGQSTRIWTSPYTRTRQTAQCIRKYFPNTDMRDHVLLCEQQFGLFDGVPDEELPIRFPAEHAHYQKCEAFGGRFWARMPMGESRFDVAQRVHQAFGTWHRDGVENLIVVSHGTTIRAIVMMWLHLSPEWFEAEPNPGNCSIRLIDGHTDRGYL